MTTMRQWIAVMVAGGLALGAAACERRTGGSDTQADVAAVPAPDTTAEALWAHLSAADYQATWALWPGKGKLYPGTEPHGMLLTTYVNQAALDVVTARSGSLPVGAVIVKENHMPDSTLAAVTVMYKAAAGYDTEHRDWFWLKRNADGTIDMQGRGGMCATCHAAQASNDYVFTGPLMPQ